MIWIGIAAALFAIDFFIKRRVESKLEPNAEPVEILDGKAVLTRVSNKGTAGGFFSDRTELIRLLSTAVYGCFLIRFLILLFKKGRGMLKFSCALVAGGGLSNLYDRWVNGSVTDYFSFRPEKLKKLGNLVFNLGDMFLLAGTVLTFFIDLFSKKNK